MRGGKLEASSNTNLFRAQHAVAVRALKNAQTERDESRLYMLGHRP